MFFAVENSPELVEDRALWHIFISANEDLEFWVLRWIESAQNDGGCSSNKWGLMDWIKLVVGNS